MADFALRNRFAIRSVALVVWLAHLFMSGCTATPSKAVSQFSSYSDYTTSLSKDIIQIYQMRQPEEQYMLANHLASLIGPTSTLHFSVTSPFYGLPSKPNFITNPAETLIHRIQLFQFLMLYAIELKNIMASTSITDLNTNIAKFGVALDAVKSNTLAQSIFPKFDTSFTELGKTAGAVVQFGLEKKRNAAVCEIITKMNPNILKITQLLKEEIGECTNDNTASTGNISKEIVDYKIRQLDEAQQKINNALKSSEQPQRLQAILSLSPEKTKLDYACTALTILNMALDTYLTLHASLVEAFNQDSTNLTANLTNMNLQISALELVLTTLKDKEK